EEGKAKSRLNGLAHGMAAATTVLPGEDPAAFAHRAADWRATLRPRNAVEEALVADAVEASWRLDRCRRADTAELTGRVLNATDAYDVAVEDRLDELIDQLANTPKRTTRHLQLFARGCRWMVEQLDTLVEALQKRGWWERTERDHALNLLGRGRDDVFRDALTYDLNQAFMAVGWSTEG